MENEMVSVMKLSIGESPTMETPRLLTLLQAEMATSERARIRPKEVFFIFNIFIFGYNKMGGVGLCYVVLST
jgi:hypothetical protein